MTTTEPVTTGDSTGESLLEVRDLEVAYGAARALLQTPAVSGAMLMLDVTGVGKAVKELFHDELWNRVFCTFVPLAVGSWPTTFVSVRIVMPRFDRERDRRFVTSPSQPGMILGRNSRIVTLAPRSANVEANSQPIAPPPMTTTRWGT